MSGSTTELALKTAVDADDTADYLTLSLADSLRTVDALFNNTTGHSHSGAHQGGPITSIPPSAIANGSITSAMIADGSITTADLDTTGIAPVLTAVDPPTGARQVTADSILKGWAKITYTGGVPAGPDDYNLAGIVDVGVGVCQLTWDRDFANPDYAVLATARGTSVSFVTIDGYATGSITVRQFSTTFNPIDADFQMIACGVLV